MSRARLPAAAAALLALATSCALFQRGKSLEVDHYTPERPEIGVARRPGDGAPSLRLGHVASGPDLGERIAYRDGVYRVGYYEGRRWTDRPELYVRRTLAKALFEEGGFRRALSGEGRRSMSRCSRSRRSNPARLTLRTSCFASSSRSTAFFSRTRSRSTSPWSGAASTTWSRPWPRRSTGRRWRCAVASRPSSRGPESPRGTALRQLPQCASHPASIVSAAPVIDHASSRQRNAAYFATSSGSMRRFTAFCVSKMRSTTSAAAIPCTRA